MKHLSIVLFVMVAGRAMLGCSDDGVYAPVDHDEPTVDDCVNESGVPDLGNDKQAIACDAGTD